MVRDILEETPAHLYAETTIRRFQRTVRDLFLSADSTLAKNYLRFLVEQITAKGNELEIPGKTTPRWRFSSIPSPPEAECFTKGWPNATSADALRSDAKSRQHALP